MNTAMMLPSLLFFGSVCLAQTAGVEQEDHATLPRPAHVLAWVVAPTLADNQSDPGYTLYKEGYSLVLEEKWAEARKKFATLVAKYPRSDYVDDAQYWTAYSYKNSDRKKAMEAYTRFIKTYPKSSYYDDAVADLNALHASEAPLAGASSLGVPVLPPALPGHMIGPNVRNLERQMKRQVWRVGRLSGVQPVLAPFARHESGEPLDDATRLKMDALYALGETREDEKSFTTLREIALDTHQQRVLRETAMDALSNFTKFDVLSVFVEIAKTDTSADLQGYAIDYIGEHGSDKNQRITVLEELYRSLPKSRTDQRATIVYTIADVGSDRAVEFLKTVALTDDNYDLRRDAVYYLGSIGGEKARSALYDILKSK